MSNPIMITGQRFGQLTAIKPVGSNQNRRLLWLCKCECGKESFVTGQALRNGKIRSCGCLRSSKRLGRSRDCEICGQIFIPHSSQVKRGHGRFCSRICQSKWQIGSLRSNFEKYIGPMDNNGCIIWLGYKNPLGYGVICFRGRRIFAHRVAYELAGKEIPEGLLVLHRCDHPPCINPNHLFVGTVIDNIHDKLTKNRQPKGEAIPWSRLTESNVRDVRFRHANGESIASIAKSLGVHRSTIWCVTVGRTWNHIV